MTTVIDRPILAPQEQTILLDRAKTLKKYFAHVADEHDKTGEFPKENYRMIQRAGFLGLPIPKEYGGLEADPLTWALCLMEFGEGCPATALTFCMHCVVQYILVDLATREQKTRYFGEVIEKGKLFASATSQPGSSFRNAFEITEFKSAANGWIIDTTRHFCSIGRHAHYFFVSGMMEGCKEAAQGLISAMIPIQTEGVVVEKRWNGTAMRSTCSDTIGFHKILVPESDIVGSHGQLPCSGLLNLFALGYAAVYLGNAKAALHFICNYMRHKRDNPQIQGIIGEMTTRISASECLLFQAGNAMNQNPSASQTVVAVNMAKWFSTETGAWVADQAKQLAGGLAVTASLPLDRLAREAGAGIVMPPHNARCLETIGARSFGLPAPTLQIVGPEK